MTTLERLIHNHFIQRPEVARTPVMKRWARHCGVHYTTLYRWVSGTQEPSSEGLKRLAQCLRVPVTVLREPDDGDLPSR